MESIDRYRRSLKRKNCAPHTVKNYMNIFAHFISWLVIPLYEVIRSDIGLYVDRFLKRRLKPKTVICHLQVIRLFFDFLIDEGVKMTNPVIRVSIRFFKPLFCHLKDDQVDKLFAIITDPRDRAMFMLMLRCGLRVEEVARLTIETIDFPRRRIVVIDGKGGKDRVVYLSEDASAILLAYLKI